MGFHSAGSIEDRKKPGVVIIAGHTQEGHDVGVDVAAIAEGFITGNVDAGPSSFEHPAIVELAQVHGPQAEIPE